MLELSDELFHRTITLLKHNMYVYKLIKIQISGKNKKTQLDLKINFAVHKCRIIYHSLVVLTNYSSLK